MIKKVIVFLAAMLFLVPLFSCEGGNNQNTPESSTPTISVSQINEALSLIKDAEECIISASSGQISDWSTASYITSLNFLDDVYESEYRENPERIREHYSNSTSVYNNRKSARQKLKYAKETLGTTGSGDFYEAVKNYYKTVSSFFTLISEYPEGYSLLTFSSAVMDYKSRCSNAYEDARFYVN